MCVTIALSVGVMGIGDLLTFGIVNRALFCRTSKRHFAILDIAGFSSRACWGLVKLGYYS